MVEECCTACSEELERDKSYPCERSLPPITKGYEFCEKKACQFCSIECQLEYQSKCEVINKLSLLGVEEKYRIVGYKLIDRRTACPTCLRSQQLLTSDFIPIIQDDNPRDNVDCWFCEMPILTTKLLRAKNFIRDVFITKIKDVKDVKEGLIAYQKYLKIEDLILISMPMSEIPKGVKDVLLQALSEIIDERGGVFGGT